jgi:hypothetical protein
VRRTPPQSQWFVLPLSIGVVLLLLEQWLRFARGPLP